MLIPFVKTDVNTDYYGYRDIDGYIATRYEEQLRRAEDLVVLNKNNETIRYDDASDKDTFSYLSSKRSDDSPRFIRAKTDGFFFEDVPFQATMEFVRMHKSVFIFGERGTENYHLMYPDHLGKAMQRGVISGGVFEGTFKYTRKGNVWCVKVV